jgi:uncharacterized membrane protein YphA (DoxX/SURF4 family)
MSIENEPKQEGQASLGPPLESGRNPSVPSRDWSFTVRATFRFCFIYFILVSLTNSPIISDLFVIPHLHIPIFGTLWPLRQITFWTAAHVFGVTRPLVYTGSGSGDKTFDWVLAFCLLVFAISGTAVWSLLARYRQNHVALYKWFRLFVRFALASEMFSYGLDKIIPLQMSFPSLSVLLEPFGNFSPMSVLWNSVGASPAYEVFAGSAELLGGVLLLLPATTTLGALVCMVDLTQVFMLNMTYNVPVKLFSFHLLLLALFLLIPEMRRLFDFFISNRATAPTRQRPLFQGIRANRIALGAQVLVGMYLIGINAYGGINYWRTMAREDSRVSLYGIWDVERMSIDGRIHPALIHDPDRWRRLIFESSPGDASIEQLDGTFADYNSSIDDKVKTITLKKDEGGKSEAKFSFVRPTRDQLVLDGSLNGHQIHAELKFFDPHKLTLVNRGFHWINEYPYVR